ncbi:MAG: glycoside hydrolase family 127 protein, partial [Bacteroidota bacterium]|nr:glycoside hydrolase family 127 protein [Bacteroidota bacterium]
NLSCCVSSGPRALLITPGWSSMTTKNNELVINLYSAGSADFKLANNNTVTIVQETSYPINNLINIKIHSQRSSSFTLKLRIPEWSKQTVLKINGKQINSIPGTYASINRTWKENDIVTLELDLRGRLIRAPSGAPQQAVMRGPILLALDNRFTKEQDSTVWLVSQPEKFDDVTASSKGYLLPKHNFPEKNEVSYIDDFKPVAINNSEILMAFEVPFIIRQWHILNHHEKELIMCDYASAGNKWSADNLYRVWIPQPMFMGDMYPKNTWNVMAPGSKTRNAVPEYIQKVVK